MNETMNVLFAEIKALILSLFAPMSIEDYIKNVFFANYGKGEKGDFRTLLDKNFSKVGKHWHRLMHLHAVLNGILINNPYGFEYSSYGGDTIKNNLWRYLPPSITFNVQDRIFWLRNTGDDLIYYEIYNDGKIIKLNTLSKVQYLESDEYRQYKLLTNIALCYWAWYDELRLSKAPNDEHYLPPLPEGLALNEYYILEDNAITPQTRGHYKCHIVRGHFRNYKTGKTIWIEQHWAGQDKSVSVPICRP